MSTRIIIQGGKVVLPSGLSSVDIAIEGGKISGLGEQIIPDAGDTRLQVGGKYVLPGFIDIHNHGAMGFDTSFGTYQLAERKFTFDPQGYREGFEEYLKFNLQHGTTRMLATTMAAPWNALLPALQEINAYCQKKTSGNIGQLAGINIEGCYLKDPAYAGAQNPEFFYAPDVLKFEELQAASGDRIAMVNVPPEHGAMGRDFIHTLKSRGIAIAGGHSAAYFEEFIAAVEEGLSIAVHFFNGPSRNSTKSFYGGGAEQAMLADDRVSLELIVDGYHVHPACARDAMARKGFENIILITDSMFMNGLQGVSDFDLAGLQGALSENGEYLQMLGKEDTLFGSVLSMDRGFANVLTWLSKDMRGFWHRQHEALDFATALCATCKMSSENPAKQLGIFHSQEDLIGTGSIEVGKSADILICEIEEGEENYRMDLTDIFLRGKMLDKAMP